MKKLKLDNIYIMLDPKDRENHFLIDNYRLYPKRGWDGHPKRYEKHTVTATVEFDGRQEDSILHKGGFIGDRHIGNKIHKRKLIEDILLIGSILTSWNWGLFSERKRDDYPVTPYNKLVPIEKCISESLQTAVNSIKDPAWQKQYKDGFHIVMLFNNANILNMEARFLVNMVIWEWLYPHLKKPLGATPDDESGNLKEIMHFVLNYFFETQYSNAENNIFHALRNQLAHSGKCPIDRHKAYVSGWMKEIPWEDVPPGKGLVDYLCFFDRLTQVIVLKTLGVDAEDIAQPGLNNFLDGGRI